jgi:NADPH:quinone reductase-like Zn-dependent oxidoreductase
MKAMTQDVYGSADVLALEYACAPADNLALKPANLTFEQAAGVPVSACTALHGLRDAGGIQAGQAVLIIGASGGVGTFAVQLAKMFDAHAAPSRRTSCSSRRSSKPAR